MPVLTKEIIVSSSPEDLVEEAWSCVPLPVEPTNFVTAVQQLPSHWRAMQTVYWLYLEVQNGGFHQFFWNSNGAMLDETQEDLQLIGATPFVGIFVRARSIYQTRDYKTEREASGNSWEGFTAGYRDKRLEALDREFYQQYNIKPLTVYLGEFIKLHLELFL
jgi:hypothetical protein